MIDRDFEAMRLAMVNDQLISRGISDKRVLDAFKRIPRHEFIPDDYRDNAYNDYPLPIGNGQTISQPYMVALMTELLKLKSGEKVLEIGTGSGYQSAILAELAKDVYSVERLQVLADNAKSVLTRLGYVNFMIMVGDGTLGWEEHSPYDAIVVTAGAPGVPENLVRQLKIGGRLVIPVGGGFGQVLIAVDKSEKGVSTTEICGCAFVPLIGKDGWSSTRMGS